MSEFTKCLGIGFAVTLLVIVEFLLMLPLILDHKGTFLEMDMQIINQGTLKGNIIMILAMSLFFGLMAFLLRIVTNKTPIM